MSSDASSPAKSPSSQLRVGIIGTGFGRYGLLPAFRRDPRCTVVAVASRTQERAAAHARALGIPAAFGDWRALLEQAAIDAIAIAAPPAVQPRIVKQALAMGIAVFAEKPFATGIEDGRAMARLAEQSGRANMIDFLFPELDTWRRCKAMLDAGAIGDLRHFAVEWRMESYDDQRRLATWKADPSAGGGVLQHFACHALYYIEWLFGPAVRVTAQLGAAKGMAPGAETLASISLQMASGATGAIYACNAAPLVHLHNVEAYGTDASLRLANPTPDPVGGFTLSVATRATPTFTNVLNEPGPTDGEDTRVRPVARMAGRFIDWCLGGQPSTPSFRDGLRNQQLIAAVQLAAGSGRAVETCSSALAAAIPSYLG